MLLTRWCIASNEVLISPAMEALDNITVWNHMGRKYMMEKLQVATMKFESPTNTGIFWARRPGASTGSGAKRISITINRREKMKVDVADAITNGWVHCQIRTC